VVVAGAFGGLPGALEPLVQQWGIVLERREARSRSPASSGGGRRRLLTADPPRSCPLCPARRKQLPVQRMLDFDFLCGACWPAYMPGIVLQCSVDMQRCRRGGQLHTNSRMPDAHHELLPTPVLPAAGRKTPSVAVIVQPGSGGGFQKLFFGQEEIAIPQASTEGHMGRAPTWERTAGMALVAGLGLLCQWDGWPARC